MSDLIPQSELQSQSPLRRLLVPAAVAALALGVLLNLGLWQLDRLAWKTALIAKVETDLAAAPVPAPGPDAWPTLDPFEIDYRHVSVTGHFLAGNAYYFTSLGEDAKGRFQGPGYMVYSPFRTSGGWTLMINRGFLPQEIWRIEREMFVEEPNPETQITITGLLRLSEQPNWTTPAADTDNMVWFARDTIHMSKTLKVPSQKRAPFSVDLDGAFSGLNGLPQAGETVVRFKNDHLGYALTWFGLAATLVGVFFTYALTVFRQTSPDDDA
ncbi:SURF1 family protein [Roseibium sp. CAU 1637]|uniref:SURF1-like protein n=1 Tax=Roseibium limicola TaxID=2816037 RepID=A0A939ENA6_9HYPH|nr:SURF1 family protein [Roseibium limicola]MBO0345895.1 SURF1 family protein [Roseibium limicola]